MRDLIQEVLVQTHLTDSSSNILGILIVEPLLWILSWRGDQRYFLEERRAED